MKTKTTLTFLGAVVAFGATASAQTPVGTTFAYQGRLTDAGVPAEGAFDFQLAVFDAAAGGTQAGPTLVRDDVVVTGGLFTTTLDFGAVFTGSKRWLALAVRPGASTGAFTPIAPRQELTPTPGALWSASTPWAGVTGKPAGFADDVDDDALRALTCTSGQIAKWNGTAWACAADDTGASAAWNLTGNAGTTGGTSFLGTTDVQPLDIRVNNRRVLRLDAADNVIAGFNGNGVTAGVGGAVIAGGGGISDANIVTDEWGTIGGGGRNRAGDPAGTAFDQSHATVGGGYTNTAGNLLATVGGGEQNVASGVRSTVGGGLGNRASGELSEVGGGASNTAAGRWSAVPGGSLNRAGGDFSLAAGRNALVRDAAQTGDADGDEGSFVWADASAASFQSSGPNQFLIRAAGGVGINKTFPATALDVAGTATVTGFRLPTGAAAGNVLTSDASGNGTWQAGSGAGWALGGNAGTSPASQFVGTTDAQPLELRVNGTRALRIEPTGQAANLVGGDAANFVQPGSLGGTVAGGGTPLQPNLVHDSWGVVGGGRNNRAGTAGANTSDADGVTIGGGVSNVATGSYSTIAGGTGHIASGIEASIGGGVNNQATQSFTVVAGGVDNRATAVGAAILGGGSNRATGSDSVVLGGENNAAGGLGAVILGGFSNLAPGEGGIVLAGVQNQAGGQYSLAAGALAKVRSPAQSGDADGDQGTFVWADANFADFLSTGPNQFLVRAFGGVGINTNAPRGDLQVGNAADFSAFRLGRDTSRHHLISNRDLVFDAFDSDLVPNGSPLFVWRRNFTAFDENIWANLMTLTDSGGLDVTGTLTKGGGSFKIDHPLDPENRYLYHSFVESPDMKNVYDGVTTTDDAGFATVVLPEWFQALNRDFRYQLTVVGDGEWARARVHRKVEENRFVVQTDRPGVEVSWQVTGIRQDPWAEQNRIPVEQDKPEGERGRYLHAAAYAAREGR